MASTSKTNNFSKLTPELQEHIKKKNQGISQELRDSFDKRKAEGKLHSGKLTSEDEEYYKSENLSNYENSRNENWSKHSEEVKKRQNATLGNTVDSSENDTSVKTSTVSPYSKSSTTSIEDFEQSKRDYVNEFKQNQETAKKEAEEEQSEGKKPFSLSERLDYINKRRHNAEDSVDEALRATSESVVESLANTIKSATKIPEEIKTYLHLGGGDVQELQTENQEEQLEAQTKAYERLRENGTAAKELAELEEEFNARTNGSALDKATKDVADIVALATQQIPTYALRTLDFVVPGAGKAASMGYNAAISAPHAYVKARNEGATSEQAQDYSQLEGAIQGGGDLLFESVAGAGKGAVKAGLDVITRGAFSKLSNKVLNYVAKSPMAKALVTSGVRALGEGVEEVVQSLMSTAAERATYNPEATVDPKELAYEGVLGTVTSGVFQLAYLPSTYKAYKYDVDLVNAYSKKAANVQNEAEANIFKQVGEQIVELADETINNKSASADDRSRAQFIKNGINEAIDISERYKDTIILNNSDYSEIFDDIVKNPESESNANIARLVARISESAEPTSDKINLTVDYLRDKIQEKGIEIQQATTPEKKKQAQIDRGILVEVETKLRENRDEIEKLASSDENDVVTDTVQNAAPEQKTTVAVGETTRDTEKTGEKVSQEVQSEVNEPNTTEKVEPSDKAEVQNTETPEIKNAAESSENTVDGFVTDVIGADDTENKQFAEEASVHQNETIAGNPNEKIKYEQKQNLAEAIEAKDKIEQAVEDFTSGKIDKTELETRYTEIKQGENATPSVKEITSAENAETANTNEQAAKSSKMLDNGENGNIIESKEVEKVPDNAVESEETQDVVKKVTLKYIQTKHTKTGEPLNVFKTSGKLSKEEYTDIRDKMKEIGGYWSGYSKGFIVKDGDSNAHDIVQAVSKFANIVDDSGNVLSSNVQENATVPSETAVTAEGSVISVSSSSENTTVSPATVETRETSVETSSPVESSVEQTSSTNIERAINASENSRAEKIAKLFEMFVDEDDLADPDNTFIEYDVDGQKYISQGSVVVKTTDDELSEIRKLTGKNIVQKLPELIESLKNEQFTSINGTPKTYLTADGKGKGVVFEAEDGGKTAYNADYIDFVDSDKITWMLGKDFFDYHPKLLGKTMKARNLFAFDENANLEAVIAPLRVSEKMLSNSKEAPFELKGKLLSVSENSNNTELNSNNTELPTATGVTEVAPQATTGTTVDGVALPTETVSSDSPINTFYGAISDYIVTNYLETGETLTIGELQKIATDIYKGSLAEGAFSVKDMTDSLELAVNHYIIKQMSDNVAQYNASAAESALKGIEWAENILKRIPTQTKRTDEQVRLQQFSTPPNIAYLVNWIANIDNTDFVLEPSAGIGGLASFAKGFGAITAVNEISERRLGALRSLGFDHVFSEDGTQLDNVLPDFVKPTVVVMNPPFSSTGGRTKNSTQNAKPHVEQALSRLENGGRLVAILGQGMSNDAPMFSAWWDSLRKQGYNIRANIGIDGANYRKYGTTFNVRLVVIDKDGTNGTKTVTGDFKSLDDIPKLMEEIRNGRTHTGTAESNGVVASSGKTGKPGVSGRTQPDIGGGNDGVSGRDNIRPDGEQMVQVRSGDGKGTDRTAGVAEKRPADTVHGSDNGTVGGGLGERGGRDGRRTGGEPGLLVGGEVSGNGEINGQGGMGAGNGVSGDVGHNADVVRPVSGVSGTPVEKKTPSKVADRKAVTNDDGVYAGYVPSKLTVKGAKPHPAKLVESSAMAAIPAPTITYTPEISQDIIDKGLLSDVQLENVSYAGQAHEQMLESDERKGYFIGDGTGVGKGRQAAGIILDNFNQGRKKALWISEKKDLIKDARRDWTALGGNPDDIFDLDGIRKGIGRGKNRKIPENGILFVPYSTVRAGGTKDGSGKKTSSNADVIIEWLGKDFDGVIVYDEAHNMNSLIPKKGSRGPGKASQAAIESNKIQEALPNARVVYMSATGAVEVNDLSFASRLGLWGEGTQFRNAEDFSNKIGASGVAGMELVATSLKSMGVYQARSISYEGVKYDTITHHLSNTQRQMYDTMCEAWQVTLQNMEQAIQATKGGSNARGQYYSALQNFYNQVLTSMSVPSVIEDIKKELELGHSCVIQLINTNESQTKEEISKAKAEGKDLEELDITPRAALLGFLEKSFPVQQYEDYIDDHGNKQVRPVLDSQGNPVLNKQAVAARDKLIERVNEISIPEGPLDMIINAFGADKVAEVTGRKKRVVSKEDENGNVIKVEEALDDTFRNAEVQAFQDGDKRILIFSSAGSTGRSFHADLSAKNTQQRTHYILQPGFRAQIVVQGFGRTHRSNEKYPPIYKLVATDVEGQKRFATSIARRLDQLGALTKGQRQTGSGIYTEKDNLESPLSQEALREFYKRLGKEQLDGIDGREVLTKIGLAQYFYDADGSFSLKSDVSTDIPKFLNRLLVLKIDEQNAAYGAFEEIRQQMYNAAIENGTLDKGIESVKAEKISIKQEEVVYTDNKTGAETKYVKATAYTKPTVIQTLDDVKALRDGFQGLRRMQDGSVRAVYRIADETTAFGTVVKKYLLQSPNRSVQSRFNEVNLAAKTDKIPESEWEKAWAEEVKNIPEYNENELHIIAGSILPVWNKLPQDGNVKAVKIVVDDGTQLLGRIIPPKEIESVLRNLDIKQKKERLTGQQIYDAVMKSGKEAVFSVDYTGKNTIKRSRVANENRLEITGNNLWAITDKYPDIITEYIEHKKRYFVPTGQKGVKLLNDIASKNTIKLNSTEDGSNPMFYSSVEGKWGAGVNKSERIKSVSDLKNEAERIFGVPINTGRINGSQRLRGVYKTHANTIRTRVYGDLPTIAHELGHYFEQKYKLAEAPCINEITDLYRDVLEGGGYNESVYPHEAVANFFADLMQNTKSAKEKAPEFFDYLTEKLDGTDKKKLDKYTQMTNEYHAADLKRRREAQVKYRVQEKSLRNQAQFQVDEFKNNPRAYIGELSRKFVRDWIDDIVDLKPFGETYDLTMRSRTSNSIAAGRLNIGFTDRDGNIIGKSLKAILADGNINDINAREFDAYLIARIALDRIEAAERGYNVATLVYADSELQDKDNIIEAIEQYETDNPTFADCSQEVYTYCNNLLDISVESGIISDSLADYLKETFPHYVPLYRSISKAPKKPYMRFKGSGRDIYSPIENIMLHTKAVTDAVLKNDSRRAFADFIDENENMGWAAEKVGGGNLVEKVDNKKKAYNLSDVDLDKIKNATPDKQVEMLDEVMKYIADISGKLEAETNSGKNAIFVMREGVREYYEIHDPDLMNALSTMTPAQTSVTLKILGRATNITKFLTTGGNLRFGFNNIPRDTQSGFISSKTTNNPFEYGANFAAAFFASIKESDGYKKFLANGGGYQGAFTSNIRSMKHVYKNIVNSASKTKRFFGSAGELMPRLIDSGESASRYAEYKRNIKKGVTPTEALRAAQEITVNFSRHGRLSKEVDKYVLYFNASIQTLYHNFDTFFKGTKEQKTAAWVKALTANVLGSLLVFSGLWLAKQLCDDDDDPYEAYTNLSTYNKNAYWCFYLGNGNFFRIAKPKDMMALSAVVNSAIEFELLDNSNAFYGIAEYFTDTFLPGSLDDIVVVGTWVDLAKNETFTGAPIVPSAYQNLAPELQYNEKTSALAVALGSVLGLSPMQIDYVIDDTTGFVGDLIINLTKNEERSALEVGLDVFDLNTKKGRLPLPNAAVTDSVYSNDIVSLFYDTKEKYDTGSASFKATGEETKKYNFYDTYGSYKYGKVASLYSNVNTLIKADDNTESARSTRAELNAIIKSVNETSVTDIDSAVAQIAQESECSVSDIAPYIVVPTSLSEKINGEKYVYELDAEDMMTYYTESQILFEALYPRIIDSGYSTAEIAEALKECKKLINSSMRDRYTEYLSSQNSNK